MSGDQIAVHGLVTAEGATAASYPGGGGCIAMVADTAVTGALASSTPWTHVRAHGGFGSASVAGGAGLIFIRRSATDFGSLIAWNNDQAGTAENSTILPALPVGTITAATGTTLTTSGATLTGLRPVSRRQIRLVTSGETPQLDDELLRTVAATAANQLTLDDDATPFAGQAYASYYRFRHLEVAGGAHLKTDAHVRVDEPSLARTKPNEFRLVGGLAAPHIDFGPATDLTIASLPGTTARFDVPKDVALDVLDPAWDPELSGSIRLPNLRTLDLTATDLALRDVVHLSVVGDLTATDLVLNNVVRISVVGDLTFTRTSCQTCRVIDASANLTWSDGTFDIRALRAGADLSLSDTAITLHGHAADLPAGFDDGIMAGDDLAMTGDAFILTHAPALASHGRAATRRAYLAGRTVMLGAASTIDVIGKGWPSMMSLDSTLASVRGGSHTGSGFNSGGKTFDLYFAPTLPGGGGGGYDSGYGVPGGGIVRIAGQDAVTLNGSVRANGRQQASSSGAGGGGGAVYVTSQGVLTTDGLIDVRGGAAPVGVYGAGGGGAIALVAPILAGAGAGPTPWLGLRAAGGTGEYSGGAGTIYLHATASDTWGHLILNNDNLTTQDASTRLPFSGAGLWTASTYNALTDTTTLVRSGNFPNPMGSVGYSVNPQVGQGTPTLLDDVIAPLLTIHNATATVPGDLTALAVPSQLYRPHYRFDSLTVMGNAQLYAEAEVYVDQGHWQDGDATFTVAGGLDVSTLDLNNVTTLNFAGPQANFRVSTLIAADTTTPRFDTTLSGVVSVSAPLRTTSLVAAGLQLILNNTVDVQGDFNISDGTQLTLNNAVAVQGDFNVADSNLIFGTTNAAITISNDLHLTNSVVSGATSRGDLVVTGDAQVIDTSLTARHFTADSATFRDTTTPYNNPINLQTLDIATTLELDNTRLNAITLHANSLSIERGYASVTTIAVDGDLTATQSADLTSTDIDVGGDAHFSGLTGDIRFVNLTVGNDVTFLTDPHVDSVQGTTFEVQGGETAGIDAGGTVRLTGQDTYGTHSVHAYDRADRKMLRIAADAIVIEGGTTLNVTGKGYPAGYGPSGVNPTAPDRGGAHFGLAYGDSPSSQRMYDSVYDPQWAGAGGGHPTRADGPSGHGGGVVRLRAATLIDVAGRIEANGTNSNGYGGAGGAVSLAAPTVSVSHTIQVFGGPGKYASEFDSYVYYYYLCTGGGGGGVAIIADAVGGLLATAAPWDAVDTRGGAYNTYHSGTGTFYFEHAGRRALIVDARDRTPQAGSTPLVFRGTSTVQSFNPTTSSFVSAAATFSSWAPVGYLVNPRRNQGLATLADDQVFRVDAADPATRTLTLDGDPTGIIQVGAAWSPRYELDLLEIRNRAQVDVVGELMVWDGSYTRPGTAGTTTQGSPGSIALSGTLTVSGAFEVFRQPLLAFVTSDATITADLITYANTKLSPPVAFGSPTEAADALCQSEATAAGLTGTYHAWLGTAASAPATRLPYNASWYGLGETTPFAAGLPDLLDATLASGGLTRDATGTAVPASSAVWTGLTSAGTTSASTCDDWTDTTSLQTATTGTTATTAAAWTAAGTTSCASTARLYCFQASTAASRSEHLHANVCALPWGGTLHNYASVVAYHMSDLSDEDGTCLQTTRTCIDGVLVGDAAYTKPTCKQRIVQVDDYRTYADGTLASTCLAYLQGNNSRAYAGATGDGIYRISYSGQVMNVYCDMTTDGGGWTLTFHGNNATATNNLLIREVMVRSQVMKTLTSDAAAYPVLKTGLTNAFNEVLFKGGNATWQNQVGTWARWRTAANSSSISPTYTGVLTSTGATTLYHPNRGWSSSAIATASGFGLWDAAGVSPICGGSGSNLGKNCPYFYATTSAYHYDTASDRQLYVR